MFIWEKATCFFEQLFPGVARTWWTLRRVTFFLGPKSRFLVQKSNFCRTTLILVNDPFLALGITVNFPRWDQFFDFPFRSYSCFHKKKQLTRQKVFPLPTVRAPSAGNSPSALSAQAHALRALAGSMQLPLNSNRDRHQLIFRKSQKRNIHFHLFLKFHRGPVKESTSKVAPVFGVDSFPNIFKFSYSKKMSEY